MVLSSGFLTDLRITHRRVGWEIWLSMASSYQRVTYPMGLTWLAERSSNFKVLQDQQIWFPQIWWWGCRDYKGLHRVGSSCPLLESNGLHFPQICTIWHLKTSRFRRHHWGWRLEVIFFSGGWVDPKGGKQHGDDKINLNRLVINSLISDRVLNFQFGTVTGIAQHRWEDTGKPRFHNCK